MPQPDLETVIFSALAQGSPSTDAGLRVYPNEAAQGAVVPYVVFSRVSTTPVNALDGHSGIDAVRMQFDCYAATKPAAKQLARQVRSLLQNSTCKALPAGEFDDRDPETGLFRQIVDMNCWERF